MGSGRPVLLGMTSMALSQGASQDWEEVECQEAIDGRHITEGANVRGVGTAGVSGNIEGRQQGLAVHRHIENPAIFHTIAELGWQKNDFSEVESQVIFAFGQGNSVRKRPEAKGSEVQLVRRPPDGSNRHAHLLPAELPAALLAADKISITEPFDPKAIHRSFRGRAGQDAERPRWSRCGVRAWILRSGHNGSRGRSPGAGQS